MVETVFFSAAQGKYILRFDLAMRLIKGFLLIELMIVVTIAGVLAAIAISQYQSYISRARWSELIVSVAPIRQVMAECAQNNSGLLTECDTLEKLALREFPGLPNGTYQMTPVTGALVITGRAKADACTVTMQPVNMGAYLSWTFTVSGSVNGRPCGKANTGVGY